jgi:hypothetical protein
MNESGMKELINEFFEASKDKAARRREYSLAFDKALHGSTRTSMGERSADADARTALEQESLEIAQARVAAVQFMIRFHLKEPSDTEQGNEENR